MTDRQTAILDALRHGPLDQVQIAAAIRVAPFNIKDDLRALRRDRYLRARFNGRDLWELTSRGHAATQSPSLGFW